MALSFAQRRANIVKALSKTTRFPQGFGGGSVSVGGTVVASSGPSTRKRTTTTRFSDGSTVVVVSQETPKPVTKPAMTARQAFQSRMLRGQGFTVKRDRLGNIEATRKNERVTVSKTGMVVKSTVKSRTGANIIRKFQDRIKKSPQKLSKRGLAELEKRIKGIKELEKGAAKRSIRVAEVFKKVPGLKGENFVQKTARALLALPARATIGVGEQAIIAGFKLDVSLRSARLKLNVKDESKRAFKQIPITIAKGYDPRTPEGLANIIATVVAFGIARGAKATPVKTRSGISKVVRKTASLAKKSTGATKKALVNTAKRAKAFAKSPNKVRQLTNRANAISRLAKQKAAKAIKAPGKRIRTTRGRVQKNKLIAREKLKKIIANEKAIKFRKAQVKDLSKSFGRKSPTVRVLRKRVLRLQKANRQFARDFRQLGFSRSSIARTLRPPKKVPLKKVPLKKFTKGEARRIRTSRLRARKKSEELIIAKLIVKGKKKVTPKTPARIRKLVKKLKIEAAKKKVTGLQERQLRKLAGKKSKAVRTKEQKRVALERERSGRIARRDRAKSEEMVDALRRARDKKQFAQAKQKVQGMLKDKRGQIGRLQLKLKTKPKLKVRQEIRVGIRREFAVASALVIAANAVIARSIFDNKLLNPIIGPGQEPKVIQAQKPKAIVKPKGTVPVDAEKVIQSGIQQLQGKTLIQQIQFIAAALALGGAFKALRNLPQQLTVGNLRAAAGAYRAAYFAFLKSRRFVFFPDLIAVLTGEKASRSERIKLLKKGRLFTGLEARKLV